MNHKTGKKKQKQKGHLASSCSDWSTLPHEILNIILGKLQHFGDRLRLASACKDWRLPVTPCPLPWVVRFSDGSSFVGTSRSVTITLEFHETGSKVDEPCHLRPYKHSLEVPNSADDPFFGDPKLKDPKCALLIHDRGPPPLTGYRCSGDHVFLVNTWVEDSKFGWLLISMYYHRYEGQLCYQRFLVSLFVYHPFFARFMRVSDLLRRLHTVSFSGSDPTSPQCVFFAIVIDDNRIYTIHTWSPGQGAWKERCVVRRFSCDNVCCVTWLDGIFYFCNPIRMVSFNPSNGEMKDIRLPSHELDDRRFYVKLLEMNSEIILLIYDLNHTERYHVLFMYDPFKDSWIRRDDFLNDRVLYINVYIPYCHSVAVTREYGNTGWSRVIRNVAFSYDLKDYVDLDEVDRFENLDFQKRHITWLAPP